MYSNKFAVRAVAVAMLALPALAHAESSFQTGAGALTAVGRLDFQITIPKILFLQVGTGTAMAANPAINQIAFTVPAANVGDNVAVAATAASGDLGNGIVTARVIGNGGNITFTSATVGALSNGSGDSISYGQINTAAATLTSAVALPAPALADGVTTSTSLTAVGKIVNQDARWTYTYKNQNVVPPGTYGGINANNSRVTYTAVLP